MFVVGGGRELYGEVEISGAKNAALPLMASAILTDESVILHNCPRITDVFDMCDILTSIGAQTDFSGNTLTICARDIVTCAMPETLSHKIRSSIFMLGSMLGRRGEACFFLPGGCEIGARPIDLHIAALEALGVDIEQRDGKILCRARRLTGGEITLRYPSVGATENILLAAACAEGVTVLRNAAREPEIVCLAELLKAMGARVSGAGTRVIYIKGVKKLHGAEFSCIPDRIEAGTYLAAVAATGGLVTLKNVIAEQLLPMTELLRKSGCECERTGNALTVCVKKRPRGFSLTTEPHPGFPTDMQSQMCALACVCCGTSQLRETVFEDRLHHLEQLAQAGASIVRVGGMVTIHGGELHPMDYTAHDLRGGAAYLIAALAAEGRSTVRGTHLIDRGYEAPEEKLRGMGADVIRV